MKIVTAIRTTVQQFQTLIASLTRAVEANTATVAELRDRLAKIETAATSTATATSYLHRAEQHRRAQACQRSEF